MRYLIPSFGLVLMLSLVGASNAEDNVVSKDASSDEDRGGRNAEMRQKLVDEFDADGDGKLSDTERSKLREKMRSRRGDADRRAGRRGRRRPVARRDGGGGRAEPAKPSDPNELFDEYDADGDGQLSRDEFLKLTAATRGPRPPRERPRHDGPPPKGRRRFDGDHRPLENRGDHARPGPPPAGPRERQRGPRFGKGGPTGGPRAAGRRREGPERQGPKGDRLGRLGHPDPARVFERFDEDGDDQLSRDEFMKLAERMRELREGRRGPGGERGARGADGGRGPRRGGPGSDGRRSGRRPPRPESAAPESAATDETSV